MQMQRSSLQCMGALHMQRVPTGQRSAPTLQQSSDSGRCRCWAVPSGPPALTRSQKASRKTDSSWAPAPPAVSKSQKASQHAASCWQPSRRAAVLTAMVPAVVLGSRPSRAADQPSKLKGLSVEQVMELKRKELLDENSFVTGKVNRAIHTDDLAFGDPGVQQVGLEKYADGVAFLFQPSSRLDLISMDKVDDRTFKTRWRLDARVNVPLPGLRLKPYLGTTTYHINSDGLIQDQTDEWDISGLEIFLSAFLPWSIGTPPAPPV